MKTNQKVPEGWSVKKLGDVCYLIAGNAFDSNDFVQEGIPLIRISNIDEDKIVLNENTVFLKESFLKENEKFKVQYNDLLIAMSGATTGKMGINTFLEPVLLNQRVCIIRAKNISQNYLNQYLFTHKKDILKQSYGGAQPNIGNNDIKKIKLLLPPLCEQKKIAEILGTWDLAIEKLTALIEQKKLLKKGLMQRLLTGKQRLPGFSAPWNKVKLKNICDISKGEQLGRLEMTETGVYPVINGGISKSGLTDSYNREKDTITISEGGNSCGFVAFMKERFWCGGHCYALSNLQTNLPFLFQILKSKESDIMKLRVGSGLPNIQKSSLDAFSLHIPTDISEQKAIADILSKADEEIDLLTRKLDLLQSQKKGLMQQLLTGKIRVKVA